jgi:hypothetical protein
MNIQKCLKLSSCFDKISYMQELEIRYGKIAQHPTYLQHVANRINERFVGSLPDETSLSEVFHTAWDSTSQYKFPLWMGNRAQISRQTFALAVGACMRGGFTTVGEVRLADVNVLYENSRAARRGRGARTMTPERALFIKTAFGMPSQIT